MLGEQLGLAIHEDDIGEERFDLVPSRSDRTEVPSLNNDADLAGGTIVLLFPSARIPTMAPVKTKNPTEAQMHALFLFGINVNGVLYKSEHWFCALEKSVTLCHTPHARTQ